MTTIIERAVELASTGSFRRITQIEQVLRREGHTHAFEHLQGKKIRRELNACIRQARLSQKRTSKCSAAGEDSGAGEALSAA